MKRTLLFVLMLVALVTKSPCQTPINVCEDCNNLIHTFDFNSSDDSTAYYFFIDSLQPGNVWQVGHPDKTLFTSGYSGPRALVTDTLNPYPADNVSTFLFAVKNCSIETSGGCGAYNVCYIDVTYKINTDSLTDGGTIEVSHNGSPFINLLEDTLATVGGDLYTLNDTVSSLHKPGFSGTSGNWQAFGITYERLDQGFDTIVLRFTFASDPVQTGKDGWMIGMVQTGGIFEGIPRIFEKNIVKVSPNPCSDYVALEIPAEFEYGTVIIASAAGKVIRETAGVANRQIIAVSDLPDGIYLLRYVKDNHYGFAKFIKTQ